MFSIIFKNPDFISIKISTIGILIKSLKVMRLKEEQ